MNTEDSNLNYDSFGNLSAIDLDQSKAASRKQIPNRLKINFDSSAKKNGKYFSTALRRCKFFIDNPTLLFIQELS